MKLKHLTLCILLFASCATSKSWVEQDAQRMNTRIDIQREIKSAPLWVTGTVAILTFFLAKPF